MAFVRLNKRQVIRGVATGVYRYIQPQNQSTLKKSMWLFFSCDPGQIRYVHLWDINICFEIAMTS